MADQALAVSLTGAVVVLDVQHLYRSGIHAGDRGTRYSLPGGGSIWEAQAATTYAAAAARWLKARGATVWTNDPAHNFLVGPYSRRNRFANGLRPDCYLACHVNAGGGDYAAFEYVAQERALSVLALALSLGHALGALPEVKRFRPVALKHGDRGAVCIERVIAPALVVEPFFGDRLEQQGLFATDRLVALGEAIASGVSEWWHEKMLAAGAAASPSSR